MLPVARFRRLLFIAWPACGGKKRSLLGAKSCGWSVLRLGQFQLRRLAILGHLGFYYFFLRRELIQPGDGALPNRLTHPQ